MNTLHRSRILITAFLSLAIVGCANTSSSEKGAVLGAVAGGILGNQVGGGSGQKYATVAGVIAGAMVGGSIGSRMDEVDKMKMAQAQQNSLEYTRSGEQTAWTNPDTGNSGQIAPMSTFQKADGRYCREFQQEITIDGQNQKAHGTACRNPDGTWEISGG